MWKLSAAFYFSYILYCENGISSRDEKCDMIEIIRWNTRN